MRKLLALLLACFLLSVPAFATFGAASAWDVRTTGSNTNGGAFDSGVGSPGTDESQGSGTAITVTLTGTTTGTGSPAFSATTHGPGNFVHIASGTGCTTGWYEILSQSAGTATFDHAMGSSTDVCTGTIGGSLLTVQQATTNLVANNTVWLQSGTYTITSVITDASSVYLLGYASTHGDETGKSCNVVSCPLITTATNSTKLFSGASNGSGNGVYIQNVMFSNTAATRAICLQAASGASGPLIMSNVSFDGCTQAIDGATIGTFTIVNIDSMIVKNCSTGSSSPVIDISSINNWHIENSVFANNTTSSSGSIINTLSGASCSFSRNLLYSNNSTVILSLTNSRCTGLNNTFYSNTANSGTGELIAFGSNGNYGLWANNIFDSNTAIVDLLQSNVSVALLARNNATRSNTSSINIGAGAITLSVNPFNNSAGGDFSLNSTSGGGAALKAAGYPSVLTNGTTNQYLDVGAAQSQASGGSSSSVQTTVQN